MSLTAEELLGQACMTTSRYVDAAIGHLDNLAKWGNPIPVEQRAQFIAAYIATCAVDFKTMWEQDMRDARQDRLLRYIEELIIKFKEMSE